MRAIGYDTDKDILELFGLAEELKADAKTLKKNIGRNWPPGSSRPGEDFVDEDTGEVVSIERNEVILERDTILTEENIDHILETGVSHVILTLDEVVSDYTIILNTPPEGCVQL